MPYFRFSKASFPVERSAPGRTYNRYRIGKIVDGDLYLDKYEIAYLVLQAKYPFGNMETNARLLLLRNFLDQERDLEIALAFSHLKAKGFAIKVEQPIMHIRKKSSKQWEFLVIVQREDEYLPLEAMESSGAMIYCIVDEEGDVSFYSISPDNPTGSNIVEETDYHPVKIGNYLLQDNLNESTKIKRIGFGIYLSSKQFDDFAQLPQDLLMLVKDLRGRGILARTGFKYGANFRLYTSGIEDHADYLLLYAEKRQLRWYEISRAVRVASAVHKDLLIAYNIDGIRYLKVKRLPNIEN